MCIEAHCAPPRSLDWFVIGLAMNILLLQSLTRLVAALPRRVSVLKLSKEIHHERLRERTETQRKITYTRNVANLGPTFWE
jgi:hypothetical protein